MDYLDYVDKVRSNSKENVFRRCEDVLDEETMYLVGLEYQRFILGEVSYMEFYESIIKLGFSLDPILENPTKFNKESLKSFNERKNSLTFIRRDIKGLLLSNVEYKNIIVYYDKPILKVLAKYRDITANAELSRIVGIERSNQPYFRKIGRN